MVGYYEQKQSRAALWCMRLAIFAIPFFIVTIYLHRSQSIDTKQAFWLIAIGISILVGAILLGMRAAADLWEKGYRGGRKTVNGITLSILLLAPFGYQLALAIEKPKLNDLSTDISNPPIYMVENDFNDYAPFYDNFDSLTIATSYPEISSRQYVATSQRVYQATASILKSWNWNQVESINVQKVKTSQEEEGELEGGPAITDSDESRLQEPIIVQVVAKSFILKLNSHVVIRMTPLEEAVTLVDMRSRSQWGPHDFGSNADNIQNFLNALDNALAGVAGEAIQ